MSQELKVNFYLRHKEIKKDGSVPIMGRTTFMVCNTAKATGGLMFLDYIKLVPRIDDED